MQLQAADAEISKKKYGIKTLFHLVGMKDSFFQVKVYLLFSAGGGWIDFWMSARSFPRRNFVPLLWKGRVIPNLQLQIESVFAERDLLNLLVEIFLERLKRKVLVILLVRQHLILGNPRKEKHRACVPEGNSDLQGFGYGRIFFRGRSHGSLSGTQFWG